MKNFYNLLLSKFKKYTFSSSDELIKEMLVDVGRNCLQEKLTTDEREPAYRFWYRLRELSSGFKFNELCLDLQEDGSVVLSKQELTREKDFLIAEFSKYSYQDALEELTLASYRWLLCCRMEQFRKKGKNEQDAKLRYCKEWGLDMGVV